MPVYKSFTAAMKDLIIPMDRAAESVVNSVKTMLVTGNTPGEELSERWKARKVQNKNTKLFHTGLLANATKSSNEKYSFEVGYDNATSGHTSDGKGQMTNSGIAEVNNEGNSTGMYNIPARPFLFDKTGWNPTHKLTIQKFIQTYYKNKGII